MHSTNGCSIEWHFIVGLVASILPDVVQFHEVTRSHCLFCSVPLIPSSLDPHKKYRNYNKIDNTFCSKASHFAVAHCLTNVLIDLSPKPQNALFIW